MNMNMNITINTTQHNTKQNSKQNKTKQNKIEQNKAKQSKDNNTANGNITAPQLNHNKDMPNCTTHNTPRTLHDKSKMQRHTNHRVRGQNKVFTFDPDCTLTKITHLRHIRTSTKCGLPNCAVLLDASVSWL